MTAELKVIVEGIYRQGRHNLSVMLVAENGQPLPEWQPGAHIDLHLSAGLVRQYSLTGQSSNQRHYQICIAQDAQSRGGSRYVHEVLRPGHIVQISAPRNLFPLTNASKVILLAAGIGITPLYAMAEALEAAGVPFVLHYYVKQRGDAAFAAEISKSFQYGAGKIWYSSEGHSPRQHLPAELLHATANTQVYICGPAGFMAQMQQQAQNRGWQAAQIHTEAFKPAEPETVHQHEEGFTVTLARSGLQCKVTADQTIARVLLDQGVDVPLSCEMGMCGACLTRVTAGDVDHRDTVQSAAEKSGAEQYIALCCSRSLSRELVIDL